MNVGKCYAGIENCRGTRREAKLPEYRDASKFGSGRWRRMFVSLAPTISFAFTPNGGPPRNAA